METTTVSPTTNNLKHTVRTTDKSGNTMHIDIRLNDECKNGHQDFAITASIWEKGKALNDRNCIAGGCCHEEIIKARPDLQIFVDLHLCDYKGIPMHPSANMHYHMTNGFNYTPVESPAFITKYCLCYRISFDQFNYLKQARNTVQFALLLENSTIFRQWEAQANEAIKLLEQMTGNTFLVDSKRTQYTPPTDEQRAEEAKRVKEGYYTPEAEQAREEQKKADYIAKMTDKANLDIEKIKQELAINLHIFELAGSAGVSNSIVHNHSKEVAFNWKSYDMITEEKYQDIVSKLQLPEGWTVINKKGK